MDLTTILKNAPEGLKLYSPLIGECEFTEVDEDSHYPIRINEHCSTDNIHNNKRPNILTFTKEGKMYDDTPDGEYLLFPSRNHRNWADWQKVLFKKGDIVAYTPIVAEHEEPVRVPVKISCLTENQKEFQCVTPNGCTCFYPIMFFDFATYGEQMRYKHEELAFHKSKPNDGQQTSKPRQLKPFDKVLVRDFDEQRWNASFYACYDFNIDVEYPFRTINGTWWSQCIPYEGNEHLLGTTNKP